jgi:hypothetical protein
MRRNLKEGDIFALNDGMEVYTKIPEKYVYQNHPMSNKLVSTKVRVGSIRQVTMQGIELATEQAKLTKSIADDFNFHLGFKPSLDHVKKFVAKACKDNAVATDVLKTGKMVGNYVVIRTEYGGGSTGRDAYPDGHQVFARKLGRNGKFNKRGIAVNFYQSGCFTAMIDKKDIKFFGKLEQTWS